MFLYSHWRQLDISTRIRIADALGIKKVGPTHVRDNIIESDGYVISDIEKALSLENLQKYLDTKETDMNTLWEWLTKGKPELTPITATEPVVLSTPSGTTFEIKKRGKRKQN